MRVTNALAIRIFKLGLEAKKKHKQTSITELQFREYMNMINVLNTVGRDESEICGYLLDRFLIPTKFDELVLPIEISYSGDKNGNNVMSTKYNTYNPAVAGFVPTVEFTTMLENNGVVLDKKETYAEVLKKGKPKFQELEANGEKFRVWLTPDEFNTLGSLILATFRASTDEDKFSKVGDYKDFGSLEDYGDRLTTSDALVRRTTTDYCPIDASFDLYRSNQYTYEKEEMFVDWFKAVCDNIISSK